MPKERVYGAGRDFDVVVGWNAESASVQLGVDTKSDISLLKQLYGDSKTLQNFGMRLVRHFNLEVPDDKLLAAAYRKHALDVLDLLLHHGEESQGQTFVPTSVSTNLDRSACNRIIAVMRRARNAAFGADE